MPDKAMRELALAMLKVYGIQRPEAGRFCHGHGPVGEVFSVFVFMDAITRLKNS